ncbi:hypothetical protein SNEBB_009489 [Seison nebaliae]|nr:hypothetical protein SNEBB_009489 [Seison nebaliae]
MKDSDTYTLQNGDNFRPSKYVSLDRLRSSRPPENKSDTTISQNFSEIIEQSGRKFASRSHKKKLRNEVSIHETEDISSFVKMTPDSERYENPFFPSESIKDSSTISKLSEGMVKTAVGKNILPSRKFIPYPIHDMYSVNQNARTSSVNRESRRTPKNRSLKNTFQNHRSNGLNQRRIRNEQYLELDEITPSGMIIVPNEQELSKDMSEIVAVPTENNFMNPSNFWTSKKWENSISSFSKHLTNPSDYQNINTHNYDSIRNDSYENFEEINEDTLYANLDHSQEKIGGYTNQSSSPLLSLTQRASSQGTSGHGRSYAISSYETPPINKPSSTMKNSRSLSSGIPNIPDDVKNYLNNLKREYASIGKGAILDVHGLERQRNTIRKVMDRTEMPAQRILRKKYEHHVRKLQQQRAIPEAGMNIFKKIPSFAESKSVKLLPQSVLKHKMAEKCHKNKYEFQIFRKQKKKSPRVTIRDSGEQNLNNNNNDLDNVGQNLFVESDNENTSHKVDQATSPIQTCVPYQKPIEPIDEFKKSSTSCVCSTTVEMGTQSNPNGFNQVETNTNQNKENSVIDQPKDINFLMKELMQILDLQKLENVRKPPNNSLNEEELRRNIQMEYEIKMKKILGNIVHQIQNDKRNLVAKLVSMEMETEERDNLIKNLRQSIEVLVNRHRHDDTMSVELLNLLKLLCESENIIKLKEYRRNIENQAGENEVKYDPSNINYIKYVTRQERAQYVDETLKSRRRQKKKNNRNILIPKNQLFIERSRQRLSNIASYPLEEVIPKRPEQSAPPLNMQKLMNAKSVAVRNLLSNYRLTKPSK